MMMPEFVTHLRSHWLMLSDVLPDASGTHRQQQAWRMLEQASKRHEVSLACRSVGPIHVRQWESLSRMALRLMIEPDRRWGMVRWWRGNSDRSVAQRVLGRDIPKILAQWDAQQPIDTVLVTEASLLDAADFFKRCRQIVGDGTISQWQSLPMGLSPLRWPRRLAA